MRRRTYLTALGSALSGAFLAGCTTDEDEPVTNETIGDDDSGGGQDDAPVEVVDSEVVEPDVGSYVDVTGTIENTSDEELGYVEIRALFYAEDGTRVGDSMTNETDVPPGQRVNFEIMTTVEPSDFDRVEIEVSTGMF